MIQATNKAFSNSIDHFFRGAFSVDIVLITFHSGKLKILLQEKDETLFDQELGLPGKLILPNEDTDKAMDNLLDSLIGKSDFYKKQLRAFSEIGRHPLGRVITFAYYGLIPYEQLQAALPAQLSWHIIDDVPKLIYDHDQILSTVLKRFKKGLLRHPTVFEILPKEFSISDVISIYEQAFAKKLDASNFGKQIKKSELVYSLEKYRENSTNTGRPPKLYSFDKMKYKGVQKDRILFNF